MAASAADRYGVMGFPVSHSRSPVIHRLFALQTDQEMHYELLQVEAENLEQELQKFRQSGGKGLNITVPHKTAVVQLVENMTERAKLAGAVNTLDFRDGGIFGDNTDGIGLRRDLTGNLKLELRDASILILGAGGAARGIIAPLLEAQPASLTIANRQVRKAEEIAAHFATRGPVSACRFSSAGKNATYSLVINATSAGLWGEMPTYPTAAITEHTVCYDLSYGLTPTPFSRWATEQGAARSLMGWGMLVEQAAESFLLWRGLRPDTAPVLQQISITE